MSYDKKALYEEVYSAFHDHLVGYAIHKLYYRRQDALDVVADCYVKAWIMLSKDEELRHLQQIKGFLFVCLRNRYKNDLRAWAVRKIYLASIIMDEEIPYDEPLTLDRMIKKEYIDTVRGAISNLPAGRKKVISLYADGFGNKEIHKELNISMSTIKTQKVRFHSVIKQVFIEKELI